MSGALGPSYVKTNNLFNGMVLGSSRAWTYLDGINSILSSHKKKYVKRKYLANKFSLKASSNQQVVPYSQCTNLCLSKTFQEASRMFLLATHISNLRCFLKCYFQQQNSAKMITSHGATCPDTSMTSEHLKLNEDQ